MKGDDCLSSLGTVPLLVCVENLHEFHGHECKSRQNHCGVEVGALIGLSNFKLRMLSLDRDKSSLYYTWPLLTGFISYRILTKLLIISLPY